MPSAERLVQVLLVEDSQADVALTVSAFRDALIHGHIDVVTNGEEALDFLRRTGKHANAAIPDLVLLDLNIPRIDGFEVLEEMKNDPKLKSIPVIVVSGSDREEDQARAYKLQIAAYLVKPADKDKYFSAVRSIKELWFHNVAMRPKEIDTTA